MRHSGYNDIQSSTVGGKFMYNGKENDESLGLNITEMDFRKYDPAIGRFHLIDRFA
ncbi:hypothetical protein DMZ48_16760 [Robertkochia solimangrovi]|nr:hypothetical protein DMZ48_16760 [Robertkochia solimangrovi]